ncbi:MAG: TonB-dependent receptor [Cyclobacteriaceae bacterium]|nr:TonB-dependent receptor [Cyclobacteriaceae bacterium]
MLKYLIQLIVKQGLTVALLLLTITSFSQGNKIRVFGNVTEKDSGKPLLFAHCYVQETRQGSYTNKDGHFNISTPSKDTLTLVVSYVGYKTFSQKIFPKGSDVVVNPQMETNILDEVVIQYNEEPQYLQTLTGKTTITSGRISDIPSATGIPDIMKAVTFLPGFSNGKEGTSHLYVRGGNRDGNLMLVDEAPVYTATHFTGLMSTFNNDMIRDLDIYKGGYPSRYGGRLSSVMDIHIKEGDYKQKKGYFNIGIVTAGGLVEGPIKKEVSSYIFSLRSSLTDLYMAPMTILSGTENGHSFFGFYDINAKVTHKTKNGGKFYLSFYNNRDRVTTKNSYPFPNMPDDYYKVHLKNRTLTASYNQKLGRKMYLENYLIYSSYGKKIITEYSYSPDSLISYYQADSKLNDNIWKSRLSFFFNRHQIVTGFDMHYKVFLPGKTLNINTALPDSISTQLNNPSPQTVVEVSPYVEDEFRINQNLRLNMGVRIPVARMKDTTFVLFEPRASLRWLFTENMSLKLGYSQMNQFSHSITSSNNSADHEVWIMADKTKPPQHSNEISLGLFGKTKTDFDYGAEVYYKKMSNLIEYSTTSYNSFTQMKELDLYLETGGTGESYGLEVLMQKPFRWGFSSLAYTLSWTNRTFENINFAKTYPFIYDRRHIINWVGKIELNTYWTFTYNWNFSSGHSTNLPIAFVKDSDLVTGGYYVFGELNSKKLPPYHRLDISFRKDFLTKKKQRNSYFSMGLFNAYLRKNPIQVYFSPGLTGNKAIKLTTFYVIPSISYGIKF